MDTKPRSPIRESSTRRISPPNDQLAVRKSVRPNPLEAQPGDQQRKLTAREILTNQILEIYGPRLKGVDEKQLRSFLYFNDINSIDAFSEWAEEELPEQNMDVGTLLNNESKHMEVAYTILGILRDKRGGKQAPPEEARLIKNLVIYNGITSVEEFQKFVGKDLSKHLEWEKKRPQYEHQIVHFPYPGKLAENSASLEYWQLNDYQEFRTPNPAEEVQLVHMTGRKGDFDGTPANLFLGSDGEFGGGFYTVSGQTPYGPQTHHNKLYWKWRKEKETGPDNLIHFSIKKDALKDFEDDEDQLAFVMHMMQNTSGYPHGMSKDDAYAMMNKINAKGKVLMFPDDKSSKVIIFGNEARSWDEYVGKKDTVTMNHSIIIGPQQPEELIGVRQITFRNREGDLLINGAPRWLGQLAFSPTSPFAQAKTEVEVKKTTSQPNKTNRSQKPASKTPTKATKGQKDKKDKKFG